MREVICDLPIDERPRERMMMHGPHTLSDSELIALLLGSGVPGKNAVQLAREILGGSLHNLSTREAKQLAATTGVGDAKAARILAAFEVARRVANPEKYEEPPMVDDLIAFGGQLVTRFARQRQERLGAAFLDSRRRLLREREIFVGTINHACVSARDILSMVVEDATVHVILYHNHPSGDPQPSLEDISFTKKMHDVLEGIDVKLVDHLIIGKHRFVSMKEKRYF